ncbi:hypothetical protein [Rhizobium freirei]|uniref:hypothetical protein n=1 Tax=Rhizobium freirei TaxID=1353277 RepID=UPI0003A2A74E|nr:hypothetical protein [Rhizobium freirei]
MNVIGPSLCGRPIHFSQALRKYHSPTPALFWSSLVFVVCALSLGKQAVRAYMLVFGNLADHPLVKIY